ncbi:MAG: flagellar basal body-associated FliL family protein [Lachnospiraceae bacterium]|nr:flagellar basal body-associated FliL family protein [Lachnospiraceae bacterium]
MKKSILTLLTLVLVLANLVMTVIIMTSLVPEVNQANALIAKVSEAIDLDVESASGTSGKANIPLTDIQNFNLTNKIAVNLKTSEDGTDHIASVSVSLQLNKNNENFAALETEMADRENLIASEVVQVLSNYTIEEAKANQEEIQQAIKDRLAGIFGNDFVVGVSITPTYQ